MTEHSAYFYTMLAAAVLLGGLFLTDRLFHRRGKAPLDAVPERVLEAGLFVFSFLVFFLLNNKRFVYYNNYSYLADALLNGRLYVDGMPEYLESVSVGGHTYMHFAPGPSLLCLPFVAIWGVDGFNIAYLSMGLGAANSVLFYRVFRNLGIGRDRTERLWCVLLAVFGTVHCFLAAVGHSWFLGHVSSWSFLLLATEMMTRHGAGKDLELFLSGLFFGLAVSCRMACLPGAVFFGGYILLRRGKDRLVPAALCFAAGAAVFGGLYMLYDYARYGTIMDKGYNLTHLKDMQRPVYDEMLTLSDTPAQMAFLREAEALYGGPLGTQHIRYNLYSIFLMPPIFSAESPYVIPGTRGVSLSVLSPALYLALLVPLRKEKLWRYTLAAMILCAIPFLLNYGNGAAQFGMRYAMDFLPYTLLLAAAGLTRRPVRGWKRALILLCVFLNLWGPVYWRYFYLNY